MMILQASGQAHSRVGLPRTHARAQTSVGVPPCVQPTCTTARRPRAPDLARAPPASCHAAQERQAPGPQGQWVAGPSRPRPSRRGTAHSAAGLSWCACGSRAPRSAGQQAERRERERCSPSPHPLRGSLQPPHPHPHARTCESTCSSTAFSSSSSPRSVPTSALPASSKLVPLRAPARAASPGSAVPGRKRTLFLDCFSSTPMPSSTLVMS